MKESLDPLMGCNSQVENCCSKGVTSSGRNSLSVYLLLVWFYANSSSHFSSLPVSLPHLSAYSSNTNMHFVILPNSAYYLFSMSPLTFMWSIIILIFFLKQSCSIAKLALSLLYHCHSLPSAGTLTWCTPFMLSFSWSV